MKATFWNQLMAHKKLHALELVLSAVLYVFFGELSTVFLYSEVTVPIGLVMGLLTMVYFVLQEQDIQSKIVAEKKDKRRKWTKKVQFEGKSYGRYSTLQIRETELSEITSYSYIIVLFFKNISWVIKKAFQFVGVIVFVILVMGAYTWGNHPVLMHTDFLNWMKTGNVDAINTMVRKWSSIGLMVALIMLWKSTFAPRPSTGEIMLEEAVAKKLRDDRNHKIYGMVYREKLAIKIKYMPEKLEKFELENLSEKDALVLKKKNPEIMHKIGSERITGGVK